MKKLQRKTCERILVIQHLFLAAFPPPSHNTNRTPRCLSLLTSIPPPPPRVGGDPWSHGRGDPARLAFANSRAQQGSPGSTSRDEYCIHNQRRLRPPGGSLADCQARSLNAFSPGVRPPVAKPGRAKPRGTSSDCPWHLPRPGFCLVCLAVAEITDISMAGGLCRASKTPSGITSLYGIVRPPGRMARHVMQTLEASGFTRGAKRLRNGGKQQPYVKTRDVLNFFGLKWNNGWLNRF